jgi:hypothetical protein
VLTPREQRLDLGYLRLSAALDLPVTLQPDELAELLDELVEHRRAEGRRELLAALEAVDKAPTASCRRPRWLCGR